MKPLSSTNLRTRLTLWYVTVLAILLVVYAALVFAFQYATLTKQIAHDEIQDVETVEGLLYFDHLDHLQLRQDYYSRPQSHLLIDRLMEVRDARGNVLYQSPTLHGMSLGGPVRPNEGDADFDQRLTRLDDGTHVLLISHIHGMGERQLLIRLGYSLTPLRQRMVQFFFVLLFAIPIALLIAGLAGQAIARRALRPVERMAARAEGITATNLHDRLQVSNPLDELGHLASVFNHLLDRLEQSFHQLQRFTADAAHELRTPVAALRTVGEVALEEGQDDNAYKDALGSILEETARLDETIDSLLLLARAEAAQGTHQEAWPLQQIVDEVLNLLDVLIEEKALKIIQEGDGLIDAYVRADRSLLRTAILNVIHNAIKFSPANATIQLSYKVQDDASSFQMAVMDEGPGIPPAELERVFERFFTSSATDHHQQSGTGLGLSVSKLVIERMNGKIRFDPGIAKGTRCLLVLPLSRQTHQSQNANGCCPPPLGSGS